MQYPTDLVLSVVLWRLRYKHRLRDLAAMFLARGLVSNHAAVREWEVHFAPLLTERPRVKRRGRDGASWPVDETYRTVNGAWRSRYRAIDRDGNLLDARLGARRDMDAARRFFARALDVAGHAPERVTTDGRDASSRAIRETLGPAAQQRTSRDKDNRIAQAHRGVRQRDNPLRGFGSRTAAARSCPAFEEQRQHFRAEARPGVGTVMAAVVVA